MVRKFNLGAALAAAVLILGPGLVARAGGDREDPNRPRSEIERAIRQARDDVLPALVFVKPVQEVYDWGEKAKRQIFGSGVIFTPDGYVLTNNHVAEKSTSIVCVLNDRRELPAEVVGRDPETDLAVLRLTPEKDEFFPFAKLGDSSRLELGDFVMALGSPYGFERSLSFGIVSSTNRYLELSPYNLWIQTDAAINPGNSGGPMLNADGEVVGINSLGIRGADNIGFAIPIHEVTDVIVDLWKKGGIRRAWLGVTLQALKDFRRSETIEAREGVLVSHVEPESPADEGGLRAGDVLTRVAGEAVNGIYDQDLPAIRRRLARLAIDEPVGLDVVRRGEPVRLTVRPISKGKQEGAEFEAKGWGMTVKEIVRHENPDLAFFRKSGVFVLGAQWGGPARSSGLRERDILIEVAGEEIHSMKDFEAVFEKLSNLPRGERRALVELERSGYRQLTVVEFERDAEAEEKAEKEEDR